MTATDRLNAMQARCDAATEGPWRHAISASGNYSWVEVPHQATIADLPYEQESEDNAAFIAAARTDIPATIAALRAVLDLHSAAPSSSGVLSCVPALCVECVTEYPCPTVCAIEEALA